ncbi:hypothetical protein VNI00_005345 [Paramarasmius palmivorus]|uniref:DUF7223 domain-containing protein n=1 Tax=Paramarasmius palmivorus TaxID=297713 RepID=A0AAW0DF67_9AGAR
MLQSTLVLLPLLSGAAFALNDWTVPCFEGKCSYDIEGGSLKIWGSPDAITDVTKAAGWTILNCEKDSLAQDIRLVCSGSEADCEHLWQSTGAVGKLVRLPESCGKSAFARISRNWVHEDQSLPPQLARSLRRRDGTVPEVQGLALDTDFGAIDPEQNGNVSIAIQGANIPGATGDFSVTSAGPARRSRLAKKGLFDFIEDAFKSREIDLSFDNNHPDSFSPEFNSFDKSVTKDLPPVSVDKTFPIFEQKISCPATEGLPAFDASIKADAATKANAVVSVGIAAAGTIIPPKFDEFGVFAGLDADLQGTLRLVGSASSDSLKGTADSGKITFFEAGVPGLDFPGILTLGPSFKVQGQAKATLDIDADVTVNLAYSVDDAKLFFPKSQNQKSGGAFTPVDSPLKLSVSPGIKSKAIVEGHIIPTLQLGISALGGIAEAVVFLDFDASAAVTLSLEASASVSTNITTPVETKASVKGCVDVGTGLDVNAGADASFFGLFDKNSKVNLFTKKFDLFNKCLGSGTNARRELPRTSISRRSPLRMQRRELTCPTFGAADIISAIDEDVPAADIREL